MLWHHVQLSRRRSPGAHAFTLVELLVVIGIIAILIALLLPTLAKARRIGGVLASPIAYADVKGSIWLCDLTGQRQIFVSRYPTGAAPAWSPQGDRIAYVSYAINRTVIVNPSSGQMRFVEMLENPAWVDGHTVIGLRYFGSHDELWRIDVDGDGKAYPWKRRSDLTAYGQIQAWCEPHLTAGFVVCEPEQLWTPMSDVVIRSMKWQLKKTIWADPTNDIQDWNAKVDYTGEWIAWTRARIAGVDVPRYIALKRMNAPSTEPPQILGAKYANAIFCDWTPDGNLLVTIQKNDSTRTLAIMSKDNELLRELDTPHGIHPHAHGMAVWRRYGRW